MRQVIKIAIAATAALALAACSSAAPTPAASGSSAPASSAAAALKVGMAYDVGGRGDQSFNDSAAAGLDKAKAEFGVEAKESAASNGEAESARAERLQQLIDAGYTNIVAVGFAYASRSAKLPRRTPTSSSPSSTTHQHGDNVMNLDLRRERGLLPRRCGCRAEEQVEARRLRRWRRDRPHQEVRGRLQGGRQGCRPQRQGRLQVPHPAAGLLRLR